MTQDTPLRKEVIEWAGYKYLPERDIWWRDAGHVLLKEYPEGIWHALLIAEAGQESPVICQVETISRLILLCLAIDGDALPLQFQIKKA